jgi:hypothetical protein
VSILFFRFFYTPVKTQVFISEFFFFLHITVCGARFGGRFFDRLVQENEAEEQKRRDLRGKLTTPR